MRLRYNNSLDIDDVCRSGVTTSDYTSLAVAMLRRGHIQIVTNNDNLFI